MKLNMLAVKKNYTGHCDSSEQIPALEGLRQKCEVWVTERKIGKAQQAQLFYRGSSELKTLPSREALSRGTASYYQRFCSPHGRSTRESLKNVGGPYVQRRKG